MKDLPTVRHGLPLAAALALAACASAPPAPPTPQASEVPAQPVATDAAPTQTTIAGINVRELIQRMVSDRFTDYHRETNSYVHYVGGVLLARYREQEGVLELRPDAPPGVETPRCEIRLLENGGVEAQGEVCGNLLGQLQADLESDSAFAGN